MRLVLAHPLRFGQGMRGAYVLLFKRLLEEVHDCDALQAKMLAKEGYRLGVSPLGVADGKGKPLLAHRFVDSFGQFGADAMPLMLGGDGYPIKMSHAFAHIAVSTEREANDLPIFLSDKAQRSPGGKVMDHFGQRPGSIDQYFDVCKKLIAYTKDLRHIIKGHGSNNHGRFRHIPILLIMAC